MSNQNKKSYQSLGPPAMCENNSNNTNDQKLPVDFPKNREYNVDTGKNEMDPKQRGDIKCDVVNKTTDIDRYKKAILQMVNQIQNPNVVRCIYGIVEHLYLKSK